MQGLVSDMEPDLRDVLVEVLVHENDVGICDDMKCHHML